MKTFQLVRQYNAAMARIRTPPLPIPPRKPRRRRISPPSGLADHVLQAAARIYQPGQVASPLELAREIACSRKNISSVITALRRRDLWPYKGGRVGMKYHKFNA